MDSRNEQQEIYKALVATADASTEGLKEISESIKNVLASLLSQEYEHNQALLKVAATNPMNPMLAQNAGPEVRPFVEKLQSIHKNLAETRKEFETMRATLVLLQERAPNDPKLKAAINQQLDQFNTLNEKYTRTYLSLQKMLQTDAMVLGNAKLSDPNQKANLEKKLDEMYVQTNDLRARAKQKNIIVENIEQVSRPKI